MKTRTFLKYTLLVAGLLGASALPTSAQAPGAGGGARGGTAVLTQEQRTKMRDTIQGDLAPVMQKLAAAQKELAQAALADDASEAAVKAKIEAVNKAQADLIMLRFKGVKAISSTLTSEQKGQLEKARDGGYMMLFGMMGGMGGGAGGRGTGNRSPGGGGGGNN